MRTKIKHSILPYSVAIAIPLTIGILSALLTKNNMMIYGEILKPLLAPPAWLFPIIWTLLYVLMGISSCIVYLNRDINRDNARSGLMYYAMSLVANFGWSILFFNLRIFGISFLWLLLLIYLIIRTVVYYLSINRIAAYIQIPYIIWVAFAGYLNLAIYILN